jgi:stage V sporulation protein G
MKMIEVARLYKFDNGSALKAFADVIIGEVLVKGVRIIEGNNGLFVTMPKSQGKDGKWYPTVALVDKSMQGELQSIVLEAYQV